MAWKGKGGEQKSFSFRVIDELRNQPSDKGDGGITMRVGAWSVDGKEGQPALEKRDYWNGENGQQTGKAKGFNRSDWEFMLKNVARISRLFGIPDQLMREALNEGMGESPIANQPEPVAAGASAEADPWK